MMDLKELAAKAKSEGVTSGAVHALIEAIEGMPDKPVVPAKPAAPPPIVVEPPAKPSSPPPGKPLVPPSVVEKGKK